MLRHVTKEFIGVSVPPFCFLFVLYTESPASIKRRPVSTSLIFNYCLRLGKPQFLVVAVFNYFSFSFGIPELCSGV